MTICLTMAFRKTGDSTRLGEISIQHAPDESLRPVTRPDLTQPNAPSTTPPQTNSIEQPSTHSAGSKVRSK